MVCSHLFQFIMIKTLAQTGMVHTENRLNDFAYHSKGNGGVTEFRTIEDYESLLMSHNPVIQAAYNRWQGEIKKIAAARGLPDPNINFGYFIENVETAVGPQEYKVGFMQKIPWLGKLFIQGDIQARKADAAYQLLQEAIQAQLFQMKHLYYDAYYLERAIEVTRRNLDLMKNWEQVILSKYRTGTVRHDHLIKAQIETMKLKDDIETLVAKRNPLIVSFGALINQPDLMKIDLPDSLLFKDITFDREYLETFIIQNNPGLKYMRLREQIADKEIRRARLNYLPDFMIGIDKIFTGNRWNTTGQPVPESGKDPLVVTASVTIPLWFYKQSGETGAAKYQQKGAESKVRSRENDLRSTVEMIDFELNDAARKVILYRDLLIPKCFESIKSSEKAYIGEEADFLDLIDAQRRYLDFKLSYEHALVRYYQTLVRIESLAGRAL